MKILATALCYNERPYIETMVKYYRSQGCDLFIVDNMSNDGTYEWLVENKVKTVRVNTEESFHLKMLQTVLNRHLLLLRPDWIVYCGIDSYYYFPDGIVKEIKNADRIDCNLIDTHHFSMYYTGEERNGKDFKNTYFYGLKHRNLQMIGKYIPRNTRIEADAIKIIPAKVYISSGVFLNYGMCKTKEERESTYARRIKAWEMGLTKGYGTHYKPAQDRNWIWNVQDLFDVRNTGFGKMIYK